MTSHPPPPLYKFIALFLSKFSNPPPPHTHTHTRSLFKFSNAPFPLKKGGIQTKLTYLALAESLYSAYQNKVLTQIHIKDPIKNLLKNLQILVVNYSRKKEPSHMFVRVLNMSLWVISRMFSLL